MNKKEARKKLTDGVERFSIFIELETGKKWKIFRIVWQKDLADAKPRLITGHREYYV